MVPDSERIGSGSMFIPDVDIFEDDNSLVIIADMPGVGPDDIDIQLENNQLRLYGRVNFSPTTNYLLSEYGTGDFFRTFTLPSQIDQNGIKATIKDGVLRVFLPKSEHLQLRNIPVRT